MTTNYKEIFAAATVEKIDEFLEDNYAIDDILEFIDNRNENDFVSFYEEYVTQGEDIGYDVVDAFIEYHGICNPKWCSVYFYNNRLFGLDFKKFTCSN